MCFICAKAKNEEIKKSIEKQLIGERILELGDLDSGTKKYFLSLSEHGDPGLICDYFIVKSDLSCFVLTVDKKSKKHGSKKFIFIKNVKAKELIFETVEDYSSDKRETTNMFLVPQKQEKIPSRGEGPDFIEMTNDGVQRIANEQSAVVVFWDKDALKKVWTAD